jgi:hypothetical protein
MSDVVVVTREDWDELVAQFRRFFVGLGTVEADETTVAFDADPDVVWTGLTLTRGGSSTGYMPLHGVETLWERATFDRTALEVRLEGEGVAYTYRVPPDLLDRRV